MASVSLLTLLCRAKSAGSARSWVRKRGSLLLKRETEHWLGDNPVAKVGDPLLRGGLIVDLAMGFARSPSDSLPQLIEDKDQH